MLPVGLIPLVTLFPAIDILLPANRIRIIAVFGDA
jgi:hypothetical protein